MIFKLSLPSVGKKALGKELFAECFILLRVFCVALGKEFFCRVPEKNTRQNIWYSAK
jgi:hypothetical protein